MMFFQMNRSTSASLVEDKASASIHLVNWQAMDWLVALASITSSSILRGVLVHGRPEIADTKSLLSKRSATSVISTFSIMYFAENLERWSRCSTGMERLNWVSSTDPELANASTCAFSARGT
ncbi:unnamed protein product, partial [Prunus brigantina]